MDNTLCAKCFNALKTKSIACHICRAKFHLICAKIEDKNCELFNNNKNVVYNCDNCLKVSSNMFQQICALTNEVAELKQTITTTQTISDDVQTLKLRFDELLNNLESSKTKSTINQQKVKNNNSNAIASYSVVSDKKNTRIQTAVNSQPMLSEASSVLSLPTVASEVGLLNNNAFEDDTQPNQNTNGWVSVQRRRRRRRPVVLGTNTSDELEVVIVKKWIHLSSFKPTVETDQIISYVEKHTKIDKQHMLCYKLVKKDADVTELRRVNFKLGISPSFYNEILNPAIWPNNIRVRPFVNFQKKVEQAQQT